MMTRTGTIRLDRYTITVSVTAKAVELDTDANRAADAVASWLSEKDYRTLHITEARAAYASALNGDSDADPEETAYGRLIAQATEIARVAAMDGWARPDAFVSVDIAES